MSRRATLAAQLAQLQSTGPSFDPDAADNLDGLPARSNGDDLDDGADAVDRDHYLDVGPSRLRGAIGAQRPLGERYEGEVRGRQKIFEDDDEDSEGGEVEAGDGEDGSEDGEEEDEEEADVSEDEEDDEEDDGEEDEEDDAEDEDEDDGPNEAATDQPPIRFSSVTASRALDPVAALRDSRQKDVLKGQAIRRQRALFESLLTIRITYQKAVTALSKLPVPVPDTNDEIVHARAGVISSLSELNEAMFDLRRGITLSGEAVPETTGKRKRPSDDAEGGDMAYWVDSARDSLSLSEAAKEQMLPILTKWSTKIQAATLSVGGKAAGSSKFLQGTKGTTGVVEAIEAGLSSKRNVGPRPLLELEEPHYRALLREIIDTRSASGPASAPSAYRVEKKKKRDAERGASKGRKIRYTVHEKASNFTVPVPLEMLGGWGEERVDELFGSLMGGVGMKGARSEGGAGSGGLQALGGVGNGGDGLAGLGGLRVF